MSAPQDRLALIKQLASTRKLITKAKPVKTPRVTLTPGQRLERRREYNRLDYIKNKHRWVERRLKNLDRIKAYKKAWEAANHERQKEKRRQWTEANREKVRGYNYKYFLAHREECRLYQINRRGKLREKESQMSREANRIDLAEKPVG